MSTNYNEIGRKTTERARERGRRIDRLRRLGLSHEAAQRAVLQADRTAAEAGQKTESDDVGQAESLETIVNALADEKGVDYVDMVRALAEVVPGIVEELGMDELPAPSGQKTSTEIDAETVVAEALAEADRHQRERAIESEKNDVGEYHGGVNDGTDQLGNPKATHRPLTDREKRRILERDLDLDDVEPDGPDDADDGAPPEIVAEFADSEGW